MKIRIYLDEDAMGKALTQALRSQGIDVLTADEAGMIERDDEKHLKYATEQGRVLYSFNKKDYNRINTLVLSQGLSHAGIILGVMERFTIGEQMRRIRKIVDTLAAEEIQDRIVYLTAWGD